MITKPTAIIVAIVCMLCIVGVAGAATTFGVETTVCAPSWYCTAYSEGYCGSRMCVDINICETNINKPTEFLQCQSPSAGASKSGGGESGGNIISNLIPNGYFTTDTDVIPITVKQGMVTQKIISINTTMPGEYSLEIKYPSSYTKGTDLVTTSNNNKTIAYKGDFNIIVDARNILIGPYVIPITISNKYYSKDIEVIIDVMSKDDSEITLYVDSKVKTIGVDTDITTSLNIKGVKLWAGENVTYTIIDPKGNVLLTEDRTIIDPANIEETISLPPNMSEGYYTLNTKFNLGETEYSKSAVFTVFSPDKYYPTLEMPQKNRNIGQKLIWIIIIAVVISLIVINELTAEKSGRRKVPNRTWRRRLMMSRPLINISFNAREKMRGFSDRFELKKDIDEKHQVELAKKKNEILRNSYEKGFISLTEYSAAIHSQGPPTEQEKEHIRREEERHKRDVAERRLKEERLLEDRRKEEEKKRQETERREREEKRKEEEQKLSEEAKLVKILEKREEKLIEKIVDKIDKEEKQKEKEEIKEEHKEEKKDKVPEESEKKHTYHDEAESKEAFVPKKSDILDKRVRDQEAFVLNSNELLYSLRDLLNMLPHMSEHVLHHHTKHGRNDFANWIGDVFNYDDIAEEIRKAETKEDIIKVLEAHQ